MTFPGNRKDTSILFLTPLPPPSGGIATWSEKLLKYGLPQGYNYSVINTSTLINRNTHERVKLNFDEFKRNSLIIYNLIKNIVFKTPSIVHINCCLSPTGIFRDFICAVIAKISNAKIVTHFRGNIGDFSQSKFMGFSYFFLLRLLRISDTNLALNKASFGFAISRLPATKKSSVYQLPNYIDDHFFRKEVAVKKPGLGGREKLRAIYVGSLSTAKGVHDFIRIAKIFSELDFVLLGNVVPEFEPYLAEVPPNLEILGQTTHQNVLNELLKSDILLFLSYSEGFPNVVVEAMAMGLAVIATTVGSIPEMINEGEGGFLCDAGDLDTITTAMKKMTSMTSSEIFGMGLFNYRKARDNYSYSVIINELCQIYEKTIKD